jgi:hypothetical protein
VTLHLVVSCTGRKTAPPTADACFRTVRAEHPRERVQEWTTRLQAAERGTVSAADLYAGEHWAVVRDLLRGAADSLNVHLWIASAGYGLLASDDLVRSYSASFSAGDADYVGRGSAKGHAAAPEEWWGRLTAIRIRGTRGPRSLGSLAARDPRARYMVVASPRYLAALSTDIHAAASTLRNGEHLKLVSSYDPGLASEFSKHLIVAGAGLTHALGGSLVSLNARVARDVIDQGWITKKTKDLAAHYRTLGDSLAAPTPSRLKMTDAEVVAFIRTLRRDEQVSASAALRRFRDTGYACEQSRFGQLFVKAGRRR